MYTVHQIFKTSQQFSANGISLFWFSLICKLCISKLLSDLIFFAWLYKIIFIATRYWNTIKKIARQVPCFRLLMNRHALMFLGLFGPSLVWNKRDFFLNSWFRNTSSVIQCYSLISLRQKVLYFALYVH